MSLQYDKKNESDRQMLIRISKKFAILFVLIIFSDLFLLPDLFLDLFSGFIDLFGELFYVVIEFFEFSLELLSEHVFHSDDHESEVIVVNLFIVLVLFVVYRLVLALPKMFVWVQRRIKAAWLRRKRKELACWHALSLNRKIKVSLAYCVGVFCILFLLTL